MTEPGELCDRAFFRDGVASYVTDLFWDGVASFVTDGLTEQGGKS